MGSIVVYPVGWLLMKILDWMFDDGVVRGGSLMVVHLLVFLLFAIVMVMFLWDRLEKLADKHGLAFSTLRQDFKLEIWLPVAGWLVLALAVATPEPLGQMRSDSRTEERVTVLLRDAKRREQWGRLVCRDGEDVLSAYEEILKLRPWNSEAKRAIQRIDSAVKQQAPALYAAERLPELEELLTAMEKRGLSADWARAFRAERYTVQAPHSANTTVMLERGRCTMIYGDLAFKMSCGEDYATMEIPGHVAFWPSKGTIRLSDGKNFKVFKLRGKRRPADMYKLIEPLGAIANSRREWSPAIVVRGNQPGQDLVEWSKNQNR